MRVRRLHKRPAALEITAFLNLIVVLVPFLLSTAVFSRLAVLELTLPAQSSGALEKLGGKLDLEVTIRSDSIDVSDRIGGMIQRIPRTPDGADYVQLAALMLQIKEKFPDKTDATLLAQQDTPYDVLVHVMDAVRSTVRADGARPVPVDLFPDISVGKAPQAAGASS